MRDGRLVRLSPTVIDAGLGDAFWLAFPPALADGPPLQALRQWLFDELATSQRELGALR